jgi:hypothetical protein
MKKNKKRLTLHKETIANLQDIQGGLAGTSRVIKTGDTGGSQVSETCQTACAVCWA